MAWIRTEQNFNTEIAEDRGVGGDETNTNISRGLDFAAGRAASAEPQLTRRGRPTKVHKSKAIGIIRPSLCGSIGLAGKHQASVFGS